MEILFSFLAGVVLTGLVAWVKNKPMAAQLQDTRNQLTETQNKLLDAQQLVGRAAEITKKNDELKTENNTLRTQLQTTQTEKIQLAEREKNLKEKQTQIDDLFQRLTQQQEELFTKQKTESELAFKKITEQTIQDKKTALVAENQAFTDKVKEFTDKVNAFQVESAKYYASLQTNLDRTLQLNENLSKEAQNLTDALKNTKKQGDWGEIILEDVLTTAGLREGIEFEKQTALRDEENKILKPDFIIHLPNKRDLVIDAKMSLTAYVKWANEPEGPQKQKYLDEHIASVEAHIKELSEKDYPKVLKNEKLDFTFMFIPIEYAYFAALSGRPTLNAFAKKHRIVIATASNLFGLMQLVENLWRIERSTQTIDQIFKIAQEMHNRVGLFTERMEDLHKKIMDVDKAYKSANTTLLGGQGIVKSAKQLEDLGVKSVRNLPEPLQDNLLPQEENPSSGAQLQETEDKKL